MVVFVVLKIINEILGAIILYVNNSTIQKHCFPDYLVLTGILCMFPLRCIVVPSLLLIFNIIGKFPETSS